LPLYGCGAAVLSSSCQYCLVRENLATTIYAESVPDLVSVFSRHGSIIPQSRQSVKGQSILSENFNLLMIAWVKVG